MPNQNTTPYLVILFMTVLIIVAIPEVVRGNAHCWKISGPLTEANWGVCEDPLAPCIDIEGPNGQPYAADCCGQSLVDCSNPCEVVYTIRPISIRADVLPDQTVKHNEEIRHTAPTIPFSVDHSPVSQEDIWRFDGIPLYHLVCLNHLGQIENVAFTTKAALEEQITECSLRESRFLALEAPLQARDGVIIYGEKGGNGASYFLPSGQTLTMDDTWWDDRVNSVRGVGHGTFVTLFENADLTGSSLTLSTGLFWPNLDAFGWGGRASAILTWPLQVYPKPALSIHTDQ